jgi:hypothetical protein
VGTDACSWLATFCKKEGKEKTLDMTNSLIERPDKNGLTAQTHVVKALRLFLVAQVYWM